MKICFSSSSLRVEHDEDVIAFRRPSRRWAPRRGLSRMIAMTSELSGVPTSPTERPTTGDLLPRRISMISISFLEVEQMDQVVVRNLVLEQAQDQFGRRNHRLDPEQVEMGPVAGVVHTGDDPPIPYFSLATWQIRMLSRHRR